MTKTELAVALTIPPNSDRSIRYWVKWAVTILDAIAYDHGRRLHGRPRWQITHETPARITVASATRPRR